MLMELKPTFLLFSLQQHNVYWRFQNFVSW